LFGPDRRKEEVEAFHHDRHLDILLIIKNEITAFTLYMNSRGREGYLETMPPRMKVKRGLNNRIAWA
jgi:hypothetical protein